MCVSKRIYFVLELVSAKHPEKHVHIRVRVWMCMAVYINICITKKKKNSLVNWISFRRGRLIEIDESLPIWPLLSHIATCMHNYERLRELARHYLPRLNASENDRGIAN